MKFLQETSMLKEHAVLTENNIITGILSRGSLPAGYTVQSIPRLSDYPGIY